MADHDGAVPPPLHEPSRDGAPPAVAVVHSSVRGSLIMLLCPLVLIAAGVLAQMGEPGRTWPMVVAVIGGLIFLYGLVSFPQRTSFDREGLTRHCVLRRHRLGWDQVRALERVSQPMGRTAAVRRQIRDANQARRAGVKPRSSGFEAPQIRGGLVALSHGRSRRYLLSDVTESAGQYEAIEGLATAAGSGTVMRARRPAITTPPTGMYRPRRLR